MKKRNYNHFLVLAAFALLGSTSVQCYWIVQGYEQARAHLEEQLDGAVAQTITDLTMAEDIAFIAQVAHPDSTHDQVQMQEVHFVQKSNAGWSEEHVDSMAESGDIRVVVRSGTNVHEIISNDGEDVHIEEADSVNETVIIDASPGDKAVTEVLHLEREGRLNAVVQRIRLENLSASEGIESRIDSAEIHGQLSESLRERGLLLPFAFAVVNGEGTEFEQFGSNTYTKDFDGIQVTRSLFPSDLFSKGIALNVQMQADFSDIFVEVLGMTALSLLFTLVMLLLFVAIWRKLLSQAKLSQMKSAFISNMSHELRTPLATISLATDALLHPKNKDDQEAMGGLVSTIRSEHDRILQHVDRVLQMANAEAGSLELKREKLALDPWLSKSVTHISAMALSKGMELEMDLQASVTADIDPLHMQSAIENLLDNAIKYNPKETHIKLSTRVSNEWIEIEVADSGIGIPAKDQPSVFDRFYRVQSGNIHAVKGFGLGLSYVRMVVLAHGGDIHLQSQEGKGSTFTIKLPVHG
ncbi:MAG: HAMP domain-containing histidine kinase [Flavobacteriales bacterium]|nr:HAMP domain-containing histidine kinase [Flavobacteriales bacterium]